MGAGASTQGGSQTNPDGTALAGSSPGGFSKAALDKSLLTAIPLPQKGKQTGEAEAAAVRMCQGRNYPITRCQGRDEDQQGTPTRTLTPTL